MGGIDPTVVKLLPTVFYIRFGCASLQNCAADLLSTLLESGSSWESPLQAAESREEMPLDAIAVRRLQSAAKRFLLEWYLSSLPPSLF